MDHPNPCPSCLSLVYYHFRSELSFYSSVAGLFLAVYMFYVGEEGMCTQVQGQAVARGAGSPLELVLPVVASHLKWELGTETGPLQEQHLPLPAESSL